MAAAFDVLVTVGRTSLRPSHIFAGLHDHDVTGSTTRQMSKRNSKCPPVCPAGGGCYTSSRRPSHRDRRAGAGRGPAVHDGSCQA